MAGRCPECGSVDPTGCNCSVCDSDCYEITGSGEETCFQVNPIIDSDTDNILVCTPGSGLGAFLPDYITDPPACHLYNSANISIPDDTATTLTFNSERYDTDSMHTGSTSKITFNTAGVYEVTLNVEWDKDENGDRAIFIKKNGADFLGLESTHAGDPDLYVGQSLVIQEEFIATDYVEAVVKQDRGSALNVLAERNSPIFTADFIRRAT